MNTEQFIQKAINIHGNKYNYDQVEYKNIKIKVKIYCNKCKEYFEQIPEKHLSGYNGCKNCQISKLTTEQFIQRAIKAHGNKYNYDQVKYTNLKEKVHNIYCNNCNEYFSTYPYDHMVGRGNCKKCKTNVKLNTEKFIQRAIKIHGNKYGYDQVEYVSSGIKIKIYCNNCKEYFDQTPNKHLRKQGCPECGGSKRLTTEQFIQKAIKIHGDKYNYNQVEYIKSKKEVNIYCNKCKKYFKQIPNTHLIGEGCPECGGSKRLTTEEFIRKATEIHENKYNYDKVNYISSRIKIKIYCNNCKEYFRQTPGAHLIGHGCQICNKLKIEEFIKKATKIHGNKYNYNEVNYNTGNDKTRIYCNNCKEYFYQSPHKHLTGHGCPFCIQKTQKEIYQYISSMVEPKYNDRKIIAPQELDIWIPSHNLAIEFNGVYWHSEAKHNNIYYHYDKYLKCQEKSITLIQIYSSEWHYKLEQIKSYIKTKLNQNNIIKTSNCNIITITKQQYSQFQNQNSILISKSGNTLIGLQYNNQLIATLNIHNDQLLSYTELLGRTIPGGLNKLLQHYGKSVFYNDNLRYTIKEQLAEFIFIETVKPDYQYTKNMCTYPKYYYPKHKFKNYDQELTPVENMKNNNYYRLWDAGYKRCLWKP